MKRREAEIPTSKNVDSILDIAYTEPEIRVVALGRGAELDGNGGSGGGNGG